MRILSLVGMAPPEDKETGGKLQEKSCRLDQAKEKGLPRRYEQK